MKLCHQAFLRKQPNTMSYSALVLRSNIGCARSEHASPKRCLFSDALVGLRAHTRGERARARGVGGNGA